MEEQLIRPGKPMDDATFAKYLAQSDFPVNINIRGKKVLDYDLQLVLQNSGNRGHGYVPNLFFGNFFRNHPDFKSIAIVDGVPFQQRTMLAFFDPKSDHVKNHAINLEVKPKDDSYTVSTSRGDRKRIVEDLLNLSKATSAPIEVPKVYNATTVVKIELKEIPGKQFYAVNVLSASKPRVYTAEDNGRGSLHETKFLLNVVAKKTKMDTEILSRIDKIKDRRQIFMVAVTPLMAEDMMTRNIQNRQLKHETVFGYSKEMEEGTWRWTNECTLGFHKNGTLIDGQHRLMAIIKSGTTQEMVVFPCLEDEAKAVLNTGRTRTTGDTLSLIGMKDPNQTAANIGFIKNMLLHHWPATKNKQEKAVTNAEFMQFATVEENRHGLEEASTLAEKVLYKNGKKLMTKTIWTGMYFILAKRSKAKAEEFLTRLATGQKIGKGDETSPIYLLWVTLNNWGRNPTLQPGGAAGTVQRVRYIITAWNHWRQGEIIEKLVVASSGPLPKIAK